MFTTSYLAQYFIQLQKFVFIATPISLDLYANAVTKNFFFDSIQVWFVRRCYEMTVCTEWRAFEKKI